MSRTWVPRGPSCVAGAQLNYTAQEHGFKLGRGVVTGRVSAIALNGDGTSVYAGAASGGVWRSDDDGAHWVALMDDQPSLAVGSIAVAGSVVYVGTGEANDTSTDAGVMSGVGILRSPDRGATWSLVPDGGKLDRTRIGRIVVHPHHPNEIFAATSEGLFVSTDRVQAGMDTFFVFTLGTSTMPHCTDVAIDFTQPDAPIIYAAFPESGIFKVQANLADDSIDIAARLPFGGPIPMAAFPAQIDLASLSTIRLALADSARQTLYAVFASTEEAHGPYRTDDAGVQWRDWSQSAFHRMDSANFMALLAVHPRDPDTVFYGDTNLWRRTQSSGWRLVSAKRRAYPGVHDDQHALAFDPIDPSVVWLGNDGGVWVSTDSGEEFYHRNRGLANAQLYGLAQFPGEPAVLLAGSQDLGSLSTHGHALWREHSGGDAFYVAIERTRPRVWYVGPSPNQALVVRFGEADANRNDHDVLDTDAPPIPPTPDPYVFALDLDHEGRVYLGGTDALYWWTGKDASRWEYIEDDDGVSGADITAIAVAPRSNAADPPVVYYGRVDGWVHRIALIGGAWSHSARTMVPPQADRDAEPDRPHELSEKRYRISSIVVDPHDRDRFWIAIGSAAGPDSFNRSVTRRVWEGSHANGVLTFTALPALPDVTIGAVTIPAMLNHVNALAVDRLASGVVYAGTDHGVYVWDGHDWERFGTGLPRALVVTQLQFDSDARRLRLSSLGRGVWECLFLAPEPSEQPVDLYLRDCDLDDGTRTTSPQRQHPVSLGVLNWTDGPDIKLDTERMILGGFADLTTVDYDGGGEIDYLGFEGHDSDRPRGRADSRVYVQIHNRGPQIAAQVHVRAFWAFKGAGGFPDLPADFWARHLGDTFDTAQWKAIGPAQTLAAIAPGEPRVARFDWTASGSNDTIGILAVISSADDPLPAALPLVVEDAVRGDKHVALRETTVNPASYKLVLEVLAIVVGVVVVAVVAPKVV